MDAYLASDIESPTPYGGLLPYWSTMLDKAPRLARMALNYLTAPGISPLTVTRVPCLTHIFYLATSVDAERAFSAGRLTINHLQHNMSSDTFQAKMAVGSWYGTPFLPDISEVTAIMEQKM
jgi:hypothetical protein